MTKINQKLFKQAIKGSGGIQSVIAERLKISRGRTSQYIKKYPKFKKLLDIEREKVIDIAESELFKALNNGEKWAINKILKTIGAKRGYIEIQKIENKNLNMNVDLDKLREAIKNGVPYS